MKQIGNRKETREVFVGNIACNISAACGATITVRGKWRLKCKRHNAAYCRPPRSPDIIPCDFYLWGIVKDQVPTKDSRGNFTGRSQCFSSGVHGTNLNIVLTCAE
jgi:hypothetical protein